MSITGVCYNFFNDIKETDFNFLFSKYTVIKKEYSYFDYYNLNTHKIFNIKITEKHHIIVEKYGEGIYNYGFKNKKDLIIKLKMIINKHFKSFRYFKLKDILNS